MKKIFLKGIAFLMSVCSLVSLAACGEKHEHAFTAKTETERYLKSAADCSNPALYYYSCACGVAGTETFTVGQKLPHDYSACVEAEEYLKEGANCQQGAQYYKSCTMCGKKGYTYNTFYSQTLGSHVYDQENTDFKFLKTDATKDSAAVFYKSCVCGEASADDTFTYGEPLRDYTDDEKALYKPTSLTVSIYDTQTSTYSFTYNTKNKPLRPVLQIAKGDSLQADYEEYAGSVTEEKTRATVDGSLTNTSIYVVRIEAPLEMGETYTYRVYDKYVDIGTESATIEAKDLTADSFTFAHMSETQMSSTAAGGTYFGAVLSKTVENHDFIIHSGDIVQYAYNEDLWTEMLDSNYSYLSRIPVMGIAGNHEADSTYASIRDFYRHFHNKLPECLSTDKTLGEVNTGTYYSFVYGNAKFIMLNTNDRKGTALAAEQYNWLIDELESNTSDWLFVVMHNPMYSIGKWGSDPSRNGVCLGLRAQLGEVFAEYGVDVVLQGHDHAISRTHPMNADGVATTETWEKVGNVQYSVDPDGVIYVMNGPVGDQARGAFDGVDGNVYKYGTTSNARSWATFKIEGNQLTMTVQYYNLAKVIPYYTWGIKKTAA